MRRVIEGADMALQLAMGLVCVVAVAGAGYWFARLVIWAVLVWCGI